MYTDFSPHHLSQMAPCNQTFTTLKCYAPSLSSDPTGPNVYLSPDFNYTIVMDGAPGPPQKIEVVPNPKFTSINLVDQNQIIGSVRSISIMVSLIQMAHDETF